MAAEDVDTALKLYSFCKKMKKSYQQYQFLSFCSQLIWNLINLAPGTTPTLLFVFYLIFSKRSSYVITQLANSININNCVPMQYTSGSSETNLLKTLTNVMLGPLGQKISSITDHKTMSKLKSFLYGYESISQKTNAQKL